MPAIKERGEGFAKRKDRLAKLKRGPGVFVYDGSFCSVEHIPTPMLTGHKEPVLDANGMPVTDAVGRQVYQPAGRVKTGQDGRPIMGGIPKVKKTPADSWTVRGKVFPAGEQVVVDNPSLALKLRGMDGFEEIEGEAVAIETAGDASDEKEDKPKRRGRPPKAETEG